MALTAGTRLGSFQIVSLIGAGGMGEVYRARDTQLDRDVALKVLPDGLADDSERLHRFEREAKALAALNHPNIAQVFGIVAADGPSTGSGHGRRAPAIAMEFVDGRSLDEQKEALPVEELLPILRQIAAALEAAHDSGIIHRDLKPANIKLRDDGTVKVLDFGLAKAFDPAGDARDATASPTMTSPATGLGVILGTAAYMSPEQARGRPVDRRADIWAFGVVAFELVTGSRVFGGETVSDTIAAVLRQDVPWDRLPPGVPPRFQRLLRHCLERDPRSRLKDAGDIRIEIDDLLGSRPGDDAPVAAAGTRPPSRTLERVGWAALVVAAVGAGWWIGASRPAQDEGEWAQFTQVTDEAGRELSPSIAPDGDSIVYASDVAGSWDIYVRRIGGRNATRIAGDPARNEAAPAFSPDGKSIAFHETDMDGGIFVIGATGESERRITEAGFHPAWSPDGRSIAFCEEAIVVPFSRVITSTLSVVDVATGAVRILSKGDAVQPAWSPSGTRLAYWANLNGQRDLYTIAAAGGDPLKVTDDPALDWSVVWAPDGRSLYLSSDRGGTMNLWRIPVDESSGRATGRPEPVTIGVLNTVASPSFSRDGRKLVFGSSIGSVNPVALPLDAAGEHVGEPRFLFRQHGVFTPTSVSPDGSMLAIFGQARTEDIWVSRVDGTGLRRLTDDEHRDRVPMWLSDGNRMVFYSNRSGKYEVWSIRKDGSALTQVSQMEKDSLNWAFPDPAGRRVWAYSSGRGSYTFPVDEKALQPGVAMPPIKVEGGVLRPHAITRDGKRLAGLALSPAGARLGVAWHSLETGETWVSREGSNFGLPVWLDDQRAVFVVDGRLAVIDASRRRRVIGGPFPFELNTTTIPAVSPDGRTLFIGGGTTEADIWMVERR